MFFRFVLLFIAVWLFLRAVGSYLRKLTGFNPPPPAAPAAPPPSGPTGTEIQELVPCPICGLWRTADNQSRCDRKDCPF